MMMNDALFSTVEDALVFAFRHPQGNIGRPLSSRMADGPRRLANGLGGDDAAGQAGLILAELRSLGEASYALAASRYLPKAIPCHCKRTCCTGWQRNPEWVRAIEAVTAAASNAIPHRRILLNLRQAVVLRHFGEKVSFSEIAKQCRVDRDTASAHAKSVGDYIRRLDAEMRANLYEAFSTGGLIAA